VANRNASPAATCARRRRQGFPKGCPEIPVEVRVDEWVQSRVEVAHPEDGGNHHRGAAAPGPAQSGRDVPVTSHILNPMRNLHS